MDKNLYRQNVQTGLFLERNHAIGCQYFESRFSNLYVYIGKLLESALIPLYHKVTMPRKCLRAMTFSDGITVPQGALLFVGSQLLHTDARYYSRPKSFDPFRFVSSEVNRHEHSTSHSYSGFSSSSSAFLPASMTLPATSPTFLAWGHGKHACPGRFLAASVMKLVLARFVYEFDIRPPAVHVDDSKVGTNEMLWIELRRRQRQDA